MSVVNTVIGRNAIYRSRIKQLEERVNHLEAELAASRSDNEPDFSVIPPSPTINGIPVPVPVKIEAERGADILQAMSEGLNRSSSSDLVALLEQAMFGPVSRAVNEGNE